MNYDYTEDKLTALPFRQEYLNSLLAFSDDKKREACEKRNKYINPYLLNSEKERYRRDFISMLGAPLDSYAFSLPSFRATRIHKSGDGDIYRVKINIFNSFSFGGLFFLPTAAEKKLPLVIAIHGLEGTPELASDIYTPNMYSSMVKRALERNAAVFAPQMFMWSASMGPKIDRSLIDARLRECGYSINALEIYCLKKSIDCLTEYEYIDKDRIGIMGISYGAYFSIMTAACDTRIKSVYSSCFFNDRYRYARPEMTYTRMAEKFLDAETAALVCPRALYIEVGSNDVFFAPESAESEYERLLPYYAAADAQNKLKFNIYKGGHKLSPKDEGYDSFFENLNE